MKKTISVLLILTMIFSLSAVQIAAQADEAGTTLNGISVSLKEIELKEAFYKSVANDREDIPPQDILAVISKWHFELYNSKMVFFPVLCKANMMDLVTYEIIRGLNISSLNDANSIAKISSWASDNLAHTQNLPNFQNLPGKDPWGAVGSMPIYKHKLPSEMKAMSIYSGKITGKCGSLVNLNESLFRLLGVSPDNIVNLRTDAHTIGLVKLNNQLLVLNNQKFFPIDDKSRKWIKEKKYYGFYNDTASAFCNLVINDEILDTRDTLVNAICKANNIQIVKEDILSNIKMDRASIMNKVFSDSQSTQAILTKYAYQSLYVKKPEWYLEASLRAPRAIELAKGLKTAEDVIAWIKNNVADASIFEDYKERVMLSDQVIVFKTGGIKDQAILAYTLLKLKGYESEIKISKDNVYIDLGSKIYNAANWEEVAAISDKVELVWKVK